MILQLPAEANYKNQAIRSTSHGSHGTPPVTIQQPINVPAQQIGLQIDQTK